MADKSIWSYPEANAISGTDKIPVAQNGITKNVEMGDVLQYIEDNISGGDGNATSIQGVEVSATAPTYRQVLMYNPPLSSEYKYVPRSLEVYDISGIANVASSNSYNSLNADSLPQINGTKIWGGADYNYTLSSFGAASVALSGSYEDLYYKPTINGVFLGNGDGDRTGAYYHLIDEPTEDGTAGQFLQTDGNGGRVWATPSGGGGGSDELWYPTYDGVTGSLSWAKSSSITVPTAANVKGADGADGANGIDGADGITPHIDSTSKHWMLGDVDTGIIAEGINGADGAQGADGAAGADGQSAYSAAQEGGYTDTESAFYADLAAIQGLAAELEELL